MSFKELKEIEEVKHNYKMKELEYQRKTEELKHEWEKERLRIKSAEIRRTISLRHD